MFTKNTFVLFVSGSDHFKTCGVDKLFEVTKSEIPNVFHLQSHVEESLGDCFSPKRKSHMSERFILVAHTNSSNNRLLRNGNTNLDYHWFEKAQERFEFIFALVCRGSVLFRKSGWDQLSKNWISFSERIDVFVGTKKSREIFKTFLRGISVDMKAVANIEEFDSAVRKNFHESLSKVYQNYDATQGDQITSIIYEHALHNLETSK